MKNIKISKKKMEELEKAKQFSQNFGENCGNCGNLLQEEEWEGKKDRRVYHVCVVCGNVELINI